MKFKQTILKSLFSIIVLALFFTPSKSHKSFFVGLGKKLVIKTSEVSPAVAAFEDIYDPVEFNEPKKIEDEPQAIHELRAEKTISVAFMQKLDQQIERNNQVYSVASTEDYEPLQGLSIPAAGNGEIIEVAADETTERLPPAQKIVTFSGAPIIVAAAEPQPKPMRDLTKYNRSQKQKPNGSPDQIISEKENLDSIGIASSPSIKGTFVLSEGMPYIAGDMHFQLSWKQLGEIKSVGVVSADEGTFELTLEEYTGEVVLELWDKNAVLVGEASLSLSLLTEIDKTNLELKLKPIEDTYRVSYISSDSFGEKRIGVNLDSVVNHVTKQELLVGEQKTLDLSEFETSSELTLQAKAEGYWDSIQVVTSNKNHEIMMFTDNNINALYSLSLGGVKGLDIENYGVVFGKVTQQGRAIAGAKVNVSDENARVIYFSEFLPDASLDRTTGNGRYAILLLSPGIHALRVEIDSAVKESTLVTEVKAVSVFNSEMLSKQNLNLQTQPFQSRGDLGYGLARVVGSESSVSIEDGLASMSMIAPESKAEVDFFNTKGYPTYRSKVSAHQTSLNILQLNNLEIAKLKHDTGLYELEVNAIGFSVEAYELELHNISPSTRIIYFNSDAEAVNNPVRNGGFIILGSENNEISFELIFSDGKRYSDTLWLGEDFISLVMAPGIQ